MSKLKLTRQETSTEIYNTCMIPAVNWWACYRTDAAQSKATSDSRCVGQDKYEGQYFYRRLICFTDDAYWNGDGDAVHCIHGHDGGIQVDMAEGGSFDQFSHYLYSERDISHETVLIK